MEGSFDLALWGVLLACGGLLVLAYRTGLPYPIMLVVGGAAVGFVADVSLELEPDLVLVIFLPPLLYGAAFFSSLRDLSANIRPISMLAIGLTTATMLAVAVVAHALIDDLSWAAAFTLGAVLSPTDPVAATAIASRVGAPKRFVTVVEGESLVNDATGLIFYRFALAATVSGTFSLAEAFGTLVWTALAGVAIGVAVAAVVVEVRRRIEDASTEILISLLTPYFAYLPAESLGASAVLAAVVSGVWLGWRAPELVTPSTRMQSFAVWGTLMFALNAALFVLVGLQLPGILDAISPQYSAGELVGYGAAVSATLIAVRFLWVFGTGWVPRRLLGRPTETWRSTFLVGFTGMRGAVSLAAALAIPATLDDGAAFPGRDLIVFLVYAAILVTVVGQGLVLGPLIRRMDLSADEEAVDWESKARILSAKAALARLDELSDEPWVREDTLARMRGLYEFRIRRFRARFDDEDDGAVEEGSQAYQRLRRDVLGAERQEIIRLRGEGKISDDVMHRIERDLDLEDVRLS